MTEHKGLPVEGYRPTQPDENIELVNVNKRLEERVLRQLDLLETFSDVDKRWLAIARTDIEKGFIAANRAIFRPRRVDLNNDDIYNDDL